MGENYRYNYIIWPAGIVVIITCIAVMLGWIYHTDIVTTFIPGQASMKFNTALCCLLLGTSLLCVVTPIKIVKAAAHVMAILACLIGLLSFLEHIIPNHINVDRFFFQHTSPESINHTHLFIMSPQTALSATLMGIALLFLKKRPLSLFCQYLLHIVTLLAFLVILGYIYQVPELHRLLSVSSMAVPTAIVFLSLSLAASLINPTKGITGVFTGNMIGNIIARKLFFSMLIAILIIGYIRLIAHRQNIISVEVGTALMTITYILISLVLIWYTTKQLISYETKTKEAQDSLQVMLDSAPYSIIKTDGNGKILLMNKMAERLFGYNRNDLLGQNLAMLIPDRLHGMYLENQKKVQQTQGIHNIAHKDELFALNKNGKEFPVEVIVCSLRSQDKRSTLVTLIDITERKSNEHIITRQLEELQSKNQELEQFNYISSHDLQEPLRTVLNYIQLLEEDYPELDEDVKTHHNAIKDAVVRMSIVVKSLLDFGRLGKQRKLVVTDVKKVMDDVLADLNRLIEASGAKVEIVCNLPHIMAYETQLRQLFQNLIANAIKFRKENTLPQISICARKLEGFYEFSVTDNGIGIDPKYHEKIFHIFQRLNRAEEYEGHGIGLANVKKIVEMHGGKIWVESAPGKGSTFRFTILNFKP